MKDLIVETIDFETTLRNKGDDAVGSFKAAPFHPENRIVTWCRKRLVHSCDRLVEELDTWTTDSIYKEKVNSLNDDTWYEPEDSVMWVGHNIGFDLHYLRKAAPDLYLRHINQVQIWDTMVAEYLLSGQEYLMSNKEPLTGLSLDDCCHRRNLENKKEGDTVKEYWDAGWETEDIPVKILNEYCWKDVCATEELFIEQYKEAHARGMLPLIIAHMEGLLATIEMEWNGMAFNPDLAKEKQDELEKKRAMLEEDLTTRFSHYLPAMNLMEINPGSSSQLSKVLFGGIYKTVRTVHKQDEEGNYLYAQKTIKEWTGEYYVKSGEPKYRNVKVDDHTRPKTKKQTLQFHTEGVGLPWETEWLAKDGTVLTNSGILEKLSRKPLPIEAQELIGKVLQLRGLDKDIDTYYVGYRALVWPDGFIHPNIHHATTKTGRLSSSQPNAQNLTKEKGD